MEKDRLCLVRLYECIRQVRRYADGGRSAFMTSMIAQDAVLWNLQLISKAAMRVSDVRKVMHPEVDWDGVSRLFRDTVGDPWRPNSEQIWQCIERALPGLEGNVQSILRTESVRH